MEAAGGNPVLIRRSTAAAWREPQIRPCEDDGELETLLWASANLLPGVPADAVVVSQQVKDQAGSLHRHPAATRT